MNEKSASYGFLALLLATCAWGGLFHVGKFALNNLDPFWFTLIRYSGAALLLLALLHWEGSVRWSLLQKNWLRLFCCGMLGYGMFGILVFVGLSHSQPSHGAVIMATMPVTAVILRWILDRQQPHHFVWFVLALTFGGVVLVSGVGASHDARSTLLGDSIALLGTLGWVGYTRGQAKLPQLSVIEYTAFTALLALPGLVGIALLATAAGWAHWPSPDNLIQVAPAMAYIVIIATVMAALAFNKGVRQLGAIQGIVFINFVPVSALLIGVFRGTRPGILEIAGTLLVISALLLQAQLSKQKIS